MHQSSVFTTFRNRQRLGAPARSCRTFGYRRPASWRGGEVQRVATRGNTTLDTFVHPDLQEVVVDQQQIQERLERLGREIAKDYQGKDLVILGVLKGAFMFTADLIRQIQPTPLGMQVDFIKASSYGSGTETSGFVQIRDTTDLLSNLHGKHVLLVEDIVDTGLTLTKVKDHLKAVGAESVKVATLLDKKARRKVELVPDYIGFECPDGFVVGYGIDYDEKYRWLPCVGILRPECYNPEEPCQEED